MIRRYKLGVLLLCLLVLGWLWLPTGLHTMGTYLVFEQPAQKADGIMVLSGGRGTRIEEAAKLYHDEVSSKVILNGGESFLWKDYTDFMSDYAVRLGVLPEDIIKLTDARSTYENAVSSLVFSKERGYGSLLIVTSKYHTRRSYRVFSRVFEGSGITLYIKGAPDKIDYTRWWKDYEMVEITMIEWFKTVLYWFRY